MPVTFIIRIVAAKNLPVMDRSSNSTDAYVEVSSSFIHILHIFRHCVMCPISNPNCSCQLHFPKKPVVKTKVANHTLHPIWNEHWIFEIADDYSWSDAPLEFKFRFFITFNCFH